MINFRDFWESRQPLLIHVKTEEEDKVFCTSADNLGLKMKQGHPFSYSAGFSDFENSLYYDNNGTYWGDNIRGKVYEFEEIDFKEKNNPVKISLSEFFKKRNLMAIHVRNEFQAKCLCKAFNKSGRRWKNGSSYLDDYKFDRYKEETCYLNSLEFYSKQGCINSNIKIYEFEELDLENYDVISVKDFLENSKKVAIFIENEAQFRLLKKALEKHGENEKEYPKFYKPFYFSNCFENPYLFSFDSLFCAYKIYNFEQVDFENSLSQADACKVKDFNI